MVTAMVLLVGVAAPVSAQEFHLALDELFPAPAPIAQQREAAPPSGAPAEPSHVLPATPAKLPALPLRLGKDITALAVAPLKWDGSDWQRLSLGVLAVGAVSIFDDEIMRYSQDHRSQGELKVSERVRFLANGEGLALLGITWIAGHGLDRPKLVAVAEDGLEASIISAGVITPALKMLVGRARPRQGLGSHSFGGFDSYDSFPSGESSQAFAIASVVAAHTESPWVKTVAWGLAGLTCLHRINHDGHWASDVVAGALIGASVGRWVVHRNRPELGSALDMSFAPALGTDHYGLTVQLRF